MNIIFLDVDGVLNSTNKLMEVYNATHRPHSGYSYPFDEKCLQNLKLLVQMTEAKLVITSTWRKNEEGINILLNELKKYDLEQAVLGTTPILNASREIEIKTFLSSNSLDYNFIILDDENDFDDLGLHLVKTNMQFGLTYLNVCDGVKKLTRLKKYARCDLDE